MSIRPNPNVHHTETSVYPNPNIHHEETNVYIQTQTLTSIIRLYPNPNPDPNVQHEEISDRQNKFLYLSRWPAKYPLRIFFVNGR